MLTLFVPAMTILFLYMKAEQTVKNQILLSDHKTLNQFFRLLDATAEEMREVSIQIAANAEVQTYAMYSVYQPEKSTYQSWEVQRELKNFDRSKFSDLFVYFPLKDRVISSTRASITADYYFDTYYLQKNSDFREEYYQILNCDSRRPSFYAMNRGSRNAYLCAAMKQFNYKDPSLSYVVVVVLDPGYSNRLMEEKEADGGTILMFSGEKELLLSSGEKRLSWNLEGYTGSDAPFEINHMGESYMMQVKESETFDGYYASVIPGSYFWRQLKKLRLICGVGGCLCAVFSMAIAYKATRRSYRPIQNVVSRLQKQFGVIYDERKDSELEFIESIFEKENKEKYQLTRKLRAGEDVRQERFLGALLEGSVQGSSPGDDIFLRNGMTLKSDRFFVGMILMEEENEMDPDMLLFIIQNIFIELCSREHNGYVIPLSVKRYALLLNLGDPAQEDDLTALLAEGKEFLERYYHVVSTLGVSRIQEGMRGIHRACEEASEALRYRYLMGAGCVIDYRKVMGREFQYLSSAESKLSRMIMGFVKEQGGSRLSAQFVSEVMDLYGIDETASMETVECFKFEVASVMNKVIMSGGYRYDSRKELVKELLSEPTLLQFQGRLEELMGLLRQKEQEQVLQADSCRQALEYIEANYDDPQLSVAMLGDKLDISGSYLSKMFREKFGTTMPDYIAQTRIRNAKIQLSTSEKSIQEIAAANGFLSSNVFIKTFKKWEGITPGVYRNLKG